MTTPESENSPIIAMKTNSYISSLASDYLELVDATSSGLYSTEATELLNSERSVLHDQLLAAMGETRESEIDMVATCKAIVYYEYL